MRASKMLFLGLLALAAGTVLAALWPAAEEAFAESCFCSPQSLTTDSRTVGGPDWRGPSRCIQARSRLLAELRAQAQCPQGACQERLVITRDCQLDDPKWYPVSGFLRYTCNECPPQPESPLP